MKSRFLMFFSFNLKGQGVNAMKKKLKLKETKYNYYNLTK